MESLMEKSLMEVKIAFGKNKVEECFLSYFKTCYTATVVKTIRYWNADS